MSERRAQPTTREEQALIDVSHAAVGRGTGLAMVIVFLALLVAVPIVDTVHQLRSAAAAGPDRSAWSQVALLDLIRDPPQPDDFTAPIHWRSEPERNRLHDYERLIEDSSLLRSSVQPVVQTALTSLFRAGNSQVIRGVDDWLFYRAGVDYCAGLGFLSKDQHDVVPRRH
ncbi:MAG TPA: hypothetical protein VEZ12_13125, partial [Herpetosiphonaceae bacterium]|nr:hypothetical protein [Herpetosiphonaceae bacterium]